MYLLIPDFNARYSKTDDAKKTTIVSANTQVDFQEKVYIFAEIWFCFSDLPRFSLDLLRSVEQLCDVELTR